MTENNDVATSETSSGTGGATGVGQQQVQKEGQLEIGGQAVGLTNRGQGAFERVQSTGVAEDLNPQDASGLRRASEAARKIKDLHKR